MLEKFLFCLPPGLTLSFGVTAYEFCDEIWREKTMFMINKNKIHLVLLFGNIYQHFTFFRNDYFLPRDAL